METSTIRYRVADFLKKHPPFHTVDEADLLKLTAQGRVRFHGPNEYLLWQGEPHKLHVFVIQQGTVSLWDEAGGVAELRDVRGPGDMLGIERFNGARQCLHSARSTSDVVVYAFPAADFEMLLSKYPHANQYVSAHGGVTLDYQSSGDRGDPQDMFLHDVVKDAKLATCDAHVSIRDAARYLQGASAGTIAVVDAEQRACGVVTAGSLLEWVVDGDGNRDQPVTTLLKGTLPAVGPDASVADGVLAMAAANAAVVTITADGTAGGRLQALVTAGHLAPVFGEQPVSVLNEIGRAGTLHELRALNHRARAFAVESLTSAATVGWLARYTHLVDQAIVSRIITLAGNASEAGCWCFCGASGREESLTRLEPQLVLIADTDRARSASAYERVSEALAECGYLARPDSPFDRSFYAVSTAEWQTRFKDWVRDPVRQQTYRARFLFDLRPIHGRQSLWQSVAATVVESVDRDFVRILAHDCLSSLPPLTFFQDAVVEESGEQTTVFRLKKSALQPLVDVGRVFGIVAGKALGSSTRERFAMARRLLPEHESIFREAADTMSVVLWQQGRIGIRQGSGGAELPPELLGRYDRQVLKSGFRSILRLLEFTAGWNWLEALSS